MFADRGVVWTDVRSLADQAFEGGVYHLCVGSYQARIRGLLIFSHLGSRLVL
jgi:hypothetical protein